MTARDTRSSNAVHLATIDQLNFMVRALSGAAPLLAPDQLATLRAASGALTAPSDALSSHLDSVSL